MRPWHSEPSQPLVYSIYHARGPAWPRIHWNSIWLRAWSYLTSHYTRRSVTTLHDFGGESGRPLDTFFRALTISWSWLLARVWSGPVPKNLPRQWSRPSSCLSLSYIPQGPCLTTSMWCTSLMSSMLLLTCPLSHWARCYVVSSNVQTPPCECHKPLKGQSNIVSKSSKIFQSIS
jgi:hypothetical protein